MPRVTRKGQVTIPQQIRARLQVETGDEGSFSVEGGKVVLRKMEGTIHNLRKYVGFLSHLRGTAEGEVVKDPGLAAG